MLFIEIHIADELLHRWSQCDFDLDGQQIPDSSETFEIRAQAMERLAKLFLEVFFMIMDPMLKSIMHYTIYLVRESKMNFEPVN